MKTLLNLVVTSLVLTTTTIAYGRNYTPYPSAVKRQLIRGIEKGCNLSPSVTGAQTTRAFCAKMTRCFVDKMEYNHSLRELARLLKKNQRTRGLIEPLKTYRFQCGVKYRHLL